MKSLELKYEIPRTQYTARNKGLRLLFVLNFVRNLKSPNKVTSELCRTTFIVTVLCSEKKEKEIGTDLESNGCAKCDSCGRSKTISLQIKTGRVKCRPVSLFGYLLFWLLLLQGDIRHKQIGEKATEKRFRAFQFKFKDYFAGRNNPLYIYIARS